MDLDGFSCIFMDSVDFLRIFMDFPGSDGGGRKPSTKQTIPLWIFMDLHGVYRILMAFGAFSWIFR